MKAEDEGMMKKAIKVLKNVPNIDSCCGASSALGFILSRAVSQCLHFQEQLSAQLLM